MARRRKPSAPGASSLPSRKAILTFIREHGEKTGKREIARAFNIKGPARAALKALLKEMAEEGLIARGPRKRVRVPGELPPVTVLEIIDQDTDGELMCRPTRWEVETPPPPILLAPQEGGRPVPGGALGVGDRILARLDREGENGVVIARLMRRLEASGRTVLGVLRMRGKGREAWLDPTDRRQRGDYVIAPAAQGGAKDGDLVLCEVRGEGGRGPRRAAVKERLGSLDDPRNISLIAIHSHGIPVDFPDHVIAEAEAAERATRQGRIDLTDLPLVTIDPADARDHDDAVHARTDDDPGNKGGFVVTVAIADVAAYVRPGSALDTEALKRGNSVYFPDRVVPMLPEKLSADLCSLRPKVLRPCLAVEMRFGADGRKRSHQFVRALMRSAAKLSYEEAQAAIDGRPNKRTEPLLEPILKPLYGAYDAVAAARDKRAPLDLDLPEHRITLNKEGHVTGVALRARLTAHRLIEEFMIQANVCAAETLERAKIPLLYRVHAPPDPEKLEALSDFVDTLGLSFPVKQTVRPAQFNRLLEKAGEATELLSVLVLRSQSQAVYAPENLGHFGLNLRRYAHFTSPIRRYADLVVHRGLIRALDAGSDGLTEGEAARLEETGEAISTLERRAMAAERDSTDRYLAAFMSERVGAQFEGRVSGVTRFGLFVRLDETGADGLVPIATLGNEYFFHDEAGHALVGERTGAAWRLGDEVTVRLEEATPVTGGLRFELLSEPVSAPAKVKSRARRAGAKAPAKRGARNKPGGRGRSRRR